MRVINQANKITGQRQSTMNVFTILEEKGNSGAFWSDSSPLLLLWDPSVRVGAACTIGKKEYHVQKVIYSITEDSLKSNPFAGICFVGQRVHIWVNILCFMGLMCFMVFKVCNCMLYASVSYSFLSRTSVQTIKCKWSKVMTAMILHARILASALFNKDMDVGLQEGHQDQFPEVDLNRQRNTESLNGESSRKLYETHPSVYILRYVICLYTQYKPVTCR